MNALIKRTSEFWPNADLFQTVVTYYAYSPELIGTALEPKNPQALEQARAFAWDVLAERGLTASFDLLIQSLWHTRAIATNGQGQGSARDHSMVWWDDVVLGASVADGLASEDLEQLIQPVGHRPHLVTALQPHLASDPLHPGVPLVPSTW